MATFELEIFYCFDIYVAKSMVNGHIRMMKTMMTMMMMVVVRES